MPMPICDVADCDLPAVPRRPLVQVPTCTLLVRLQKLLALICWAVFIARYYFDEL